MPTDLPIVPEEVQIKINAKKTKTLTAYEHGKEIERTISLYGTVIEEVKSFCYIGNHITHDNKYTTEIKRTVLTKQAFFKKQSLLTNLSIRIRKL